MRAVAYVRASTDDQEITLASQAEKIRAYCIVRGLELVAILDDAGVSGSIALGMRPAGKKLVRHLRRQDASHIVALKLDRLFRDASDALAQTRAWYRAGVALHLCDMGGGAVDTSSPMGRMMLIMLAGFAEFERALIAERTTAALRHKKAQGEYTGGGRPYGQLVKAGRLVDDPAELAAMADARRMRGEGLSLRAIGQELAAAGVVARNGRVLAAEQVKRMIGG